jgi:Cft2 family RNA processing exonuclease
MTLNSDNSEKVPEISTGYSIISHGGIGDEHGKSKERKTPKHNLSWSCHELRVFFGEEVIRILIDIWGYQGWWELIRDLKQVSEWVTAILLTHPHMDHIGELPVIFTEESQFKWRIITTPGTMNATTIALTDAANIMAREHAEKMNGYIKMLQDIASALFVLKSNQSWKKQVKKYRGNRVAQTGDIPNHRQDIADAHAILEKYGVDTDSEIGYKEQMKQFEPKKPLYGIDEVITALSQIETHTIKNTWNELVPWKVAFSFYNAGHIIWSVSILFRITQNNQDRHVLFSWDLGSYKWDFHPTGIALPPHNIPVETVMIESTYGNKVRSNFAEWLRNFENNLIWDIEKYERIVISTFAMDRTQNLLYRLIKMKQEWKIDVDIILDSPAGINHTMNYAQHANQIDDTILATHAPSIKKLLQNNFVEKESESLKRFAEYIDPANSHYAIATKINKGSLLLGDRPKIVLTSSGMADGGMVISHLEKNIWNPKHVFYFPGYLVSGTLGHALANEDQPGGQQKLVQIWWKEYEVKARMKQFNFLSGHGDAEDLRSWLAAIKMKKDANILVVHGDVTGSSLEFAHGLERTGKYDDKNILVPRIGEVNNFPEPPKKK